MLHALSNHPINWSGMTAYVLTGILMRWSILPVRFGKATNLIFLTSSLIWRLWMKHREHSCPRCSTTTRRLSAFHPKIYVICHFWPLRGLLPVSSFIFPVVVASPSYKTRSPKYKYDSFKSYTAFKTVWLNLLILLLQRWAVPPTWWSKLWGFFR